MADIRVTEEMFLTIDINVDANARITEEMYTPIAVNEDAECRITEIVYLACVIPPNPSAFRELISPMAGF